LYLLRTLRRRPTPSTTAQRTLDYCSCWFQNFKASDAHSSHSATLRNLAKIRREAHQRSKAHKGSTSAQRARQRNQAQTNSNKHSENKNWRPPPCSTGRVKVRLLTSFLESTKIWGLSLRSKPFLFLTNFTAKNAARRMGLQFPEPLPCAS